MAQKDVTQTDEGLRRKIVARFGGTDPEAIVTWLKAWGYKLRVDYYWEAPADRVVSPAEYEALLFLNKEHGFGWIVADLVREGKLKKCLTCGEPLTLAKPGKIYCSITCQQRAHYKRKAARESAAQAAKKAAKTGERRGATE